MEYVNTFYILFVTWSINSFICNTKSCDVCDKWRKATGWRYDVTEIFNHHSPFKLSSWLGFRHWFKPYPLPKKEEYNG